MKIVLEICDKGNVHGLYTDKIDLFAIGRVQNVRKASNVEFCEKLQKWQVTSLDGKVLYTNKNRENAIEWEIEKFSPGNQYYEN
jgi:hypothetical protein